MPPAYECGVPGGSTDERTRASPVLDASAVGNILRFVRSGCIRPFDSLLAGHDPGVGIRVDLDENLDARGLATLALMRDNALPALVMAQPLGTDFGHMREGRLIPAADAIDALRVAARGFSLGLLVNPGRAIVAGASSPSLVLRDARAALAAAGLQLSGVGSPAGADPGSAFGRWWLYRAAGRLTPDRSLRDLAEFPLQSYEWLFERLDPELGPLVDGIESLRATVSTASEEWYLADFGFPTRLRVRLFPRLAVDIVVTTDPAGWRWVERGGVASMLDTGTAASRLADAVSRVRVALTIRTRDLSPPPSSAGGPIRSMPWPFDRWLAVASDTDWTTWAHLNMQANAICNDLGVPFAGSAYLTSHGPLWPSWDSLTRGALELGEGVLDTIHGLARSLDQVDLAPAQRVDSEVEIALPELTTDDTRVVVTVEGEPDCLVVEWAFPDGRRLTAEPRWTHDERVARSHLVARYPDGEGVPVVLRLRPYRRDFVKIVRVFLTAAVNDDFASALEGGGCAAPVFTAHGGGSAVDTLGQLRTHYGLSVYPEQAEFAMDNPASPFYALRMLRESGVAFFNPLDVLFRPEVTILEDLLEPEHGLDGSSYYCFRRYIYPPALEEAPGMSWPHAKHAATTQALPAVLDELRRRLHSGRFGEGAIVYTHLGNRVGNQLAPRLGWTEALYAILEFLAERYLVRDTLTPPSWRLWITTPAGVLAFAALLRGLADNVIVEGSRVTIRSWIDPVLGHRIPDPVRFGGAWLHGATVYVESASAAEVVVDGTPYVAITRNPADATGRESITLIDDRAATILVGEGGALEASAAGAVRDLGLVSLRNATHLRIEADADATVQWELLLQTDLDETFGIGTLGASSWPLETEAGRLRKVVPLFDCRGARRPRGHLRSVAVRVAGTGSVRIRRLELLRPFPAWCKVPNRAPGVATQQ